MLKNKLISFDVTESGRQQTIIYSEKTVTRAFMPLIEELSVMYNRSPRHPYCLAISGPPGSGKSSIASLFQLFFSEKDIHSYVLPLDGFHMKNRELKKRTMRRKKRTLTLYEIKGAQESYNTASLVNCMEKLVSGEKFYWPLYSRELHEPVDRGILVKERHAVYIIEGNYLFLDTVPWNKISCFFDTGIFITSSKRFIKRRVINRKIGGGFGPKEAKAHYRRCDRKNINEVLTLSKNYDYLLIQKGRYRYSLGNVDTKSG